MRCYVTWPLSGGLPHCEPSQRVERKLAAASAELTERLATQQRLDDGDRAAGTQQVDAVRSNLEAQQSVLRAQLETVLVTVFV